jgi:hypoxanthine phosphoribosyltransferase
LITVKDRQFRLFIPYEEIQQKIRVMGEQIDREYRDKDLLFLSILTGSFMFTADLLKHITTDCEVAFTRVASYKGMQSTGVVRSLMGFDENVKGRYVIILEDIIDSGRTMNSLIPELQKLEPAGIAIASLIIKPEALKHPVKVSYSCFSISNEFIVGYGLDYDGYGRNLKDIYQVVE